MSSPWRASCAARARMARRAHLSIPADTAGQYCARQSRRAARQAARHAARRVGEVCIGSRNSARRACRAIRATSCAAELCAESQKRDAVQNARTKSAIRRNPRRRKDLSALQNARRTLQIAMRESEKSAPGRENWRWTPMQNALLLHCKLQC